MTHQIRTKINFLSVGSNFYVNGVKSSSSICEEYLKKMRNHLLLDYFNCSCTLHNCSFTLHKTLNIERALSLQPKEDWLSVPKHRNQSSNQIMSNYWKYLQQYNSFMEISGRETSQYFVMFLFMSVRVSVLYGLDVWGLCEV